eukprot:1155993-Pelagomonas_calceolata.AAC.17
MEYFMKLIKKKYGKDVSKDIRAISKLRREAERAKRALSSQHQVCEGEFLPVEACCCEVDGQHEDARIVINSSVLGVIYCRCFARAMPALMKGIHDALALGILFSLIDIGSASTAFLPATGPRGD